jgi:hypothetical protein
MCDGPMVEIRFAVNKHAQIFDAVRAPQRRIRGDNNNNNGTRVATSFWVLFEDFLIQFF